MDLKTIPLDNGNLRTHQVEAKKNIIEAWNQYNSVMLQMPTGTGKTFLFTSLIKDLLSYYKANHIEINILIVAHRTELLDQISDSLSRYDIPHGFIQGSREQHLWQRIQVGSIMSLLTSKNEMNVRRMNFDYIIVDEAHHSLAETYKKLFETFPSAKKLGVTATPWRLNHETFCSLYDKLITTPQVSWFIQQGLLADFEYVSIKPDSEIQKLVDHTQIAETGDFVNVELDNAFNNQRIRSKLYASYKRFANGKKGVVYAINKQHATNIAYMYTEKGVNAVAIDCDTPKEERQRLIELFKEGSITILVNVDIFTEGFDCPDITFIQLARPTRSLALYLQQVGRGLRIVKGKDKTIILDNVGLYNYFGLPDADRDWQSFFTAYELEEDEKEKRSKQENNEAAEPIEQNFEEDNEQMTVIKKAHDLKNDILPKESQTVEEVKDYLICNYYLLRGNNRQFRIYPVVKKKGNPTNDIGRCQFEYVEEYGQILFGPDWQSNLNLLARNPKIQIIVSFLATFIEMPLKKVMNIEYMAQCAKIPVTGSCSLFKMLQMIQKVWSEKQMAS